MLSVFLLQLAGGSMFIVGLSRIHDVAWRYLRLMAIVSMSVLGLAAALVIADRGFSVEQLRYEPYWTLALALGLAFGWLITITWQAGRVRNTQRFWAILGGWISLGSAVVLAQSALFRSTSRATATVPASLELHEATVATVLGGLLIGSVTAAMLLGHRYLTDTGMTIAPLRRLTNFFIGATVLRALGVAIGIYFGRAALTSDDASRQWVLFFLAIRVAIGILGTAVFAYMIWDCVRRRSTQSATGILYLTMVFVFIGELTAQYLLRWKGLAV